MKKLSNTEAELKKGVAFEKKRVYDLTVLVLHFGKLHNHTV